MKWSHFYTVLVSLLLWWAIIMLCSRLAHCQDYEGMIDMDIIAKIESNNNPKAYNKRSGCIGLCQINPKGALADWNNDFAIKYKPKDLYNPLINKQIANYYMNSKIPYYLKKLKKSDTVTNRLVAYNAGIGRVGKPLCNETKVYIAKYMKLLAKKQLTK